MHHTINAYHGDPAFKAECVARAQEHADADRLRSGFYIRLFGDDDCWKGCSVGCDYYDIRGQDGENHHAVTAKYFGFPEWLEHLRDGIFEGLSEAERNGWHVRLKEAVPVGLDEAGFERVRHQLAVRTLTRLRDQQRQATPDDPWGVIAALNQMIAYHAEVAKGQYSVMARSAAESAAWSAESAAESAAWSAESAAWAARSAAWSAAWAAAASAAWAARSAARSAAWSEQAADVLELLENA